jgi:hypothetical protein
VWDVSATALAAIATVTAGYATSVWFLVNRIDRRLERVEDRLGGVEKAVERVAVHVADSRAHR